MSTNETNLNTSQGIDFQQALSILSQRSSTTSDHAHNHEHAGASCPCQAPASQAATEAVQKMGQVIHLDVDGNDSPRMDNNTASPSNGDTKPQMFPSLPLGSPKPEVLKAFQSFSTRQLLQAVLSAQHDRVATYREYNDGLQAVLATNHIAYYPTVCTEATAKFAVIGDTLQAIQTTFAQRNAASNRNSRNSDNNSPEIQQLIRTLQQYEQQKLQYTAALHLEQIRLHQTSSTSTTGGIHDDDTRSQRLLEESTRALQHKLTSCIEQINEVLEEMQCALLEAPNDDGLTEEE